MKINHIIDILEDNFRMQPLQYNKINLRDKQVQLEFLIIYLNQFKLNHLFLKIFLLDKILLSYINCNSRNRSSLNTNFQILKIVSIYILISHASYLNLIATFKNNILRNLLKLYNEKNSQNRTIDYLILLFNLSLNYLSPNFFLK